MNRIRDAITTVFAVLGIGTVVIGIWLGSSAVWIYFLIWIGRLIDGR